MKQCFVFFIFCLSVIFVPPATAHPYLLDAEITDTFGNIRADVVFHGIEKDKEEETEVEDVKFPSEEWFWSNFIFLLIMCISLIMACVVLLTFKEDIKNRISNLVRKGLFFDTL